jgi:predicted acyl esterase
VARLFAATTGTDADWVVKLIDVYPDRVKDDEKMGGYELMVSSEIMRGLGTGRVSRGRSPSPRERCWTTRWTCISRLTGSCRATG